MQNSENRIVDIEEKSTGISGIAKIHGDEVSVFYGARDGSDDKIMTREQFEKDFEVKAVLINL
jgi:hypothetical protein